MSDVAQLTLTYMKTEKHNPDYLLVSVTINGKEFVYGEDQFGQNKGLEVYHGVNINAERGFTKSYRYTEDKIPMIYNELYLNLKRLSKNLVTGNKYTYTQSEYQSFVKDRCLVS